MARAQGARAQMALAFESSYGTAPSAGEFWQMPFASCNLGSEQNLLASELLGYGRDPTAPIGDAINVDGDITVPIDARFFGIWLKAVFGAPTTTGPAAGVYTHVFQSGGWTLPSLAIEIGMPDVPFFGLNTGCVVNQLSWTMQRSGLITAQVNLIAQGEVTGSASVVGALNALPLTRFGAFQGAISREGSQLGNVVSAQVSNSNNLERIEVIRDDGRIEGADPSIAALIGTIEVRFADQTLLDQAVSGAPAEAGTVRNSVWGRAIEHQPARAFRKRSPKRTANCALAIAHSLGGIFHSFSDRFKTRNSNFIAASSVGKCPLARTARRSFEFKASMALVV